jgi:hypothetical protein
MAVQPVPDAVVATLSLGFWPNVMETLNARVAPNTFLEVFPHHPHSTTKHWAHQSNRETVVSLMKTLQKLRNRVCHSEPVWKLHTLDVTGRRWWHAVQGLRDRHEELLQLLEWCGGPVCVEAYRNTFAWNWFNVLCTTGAVKDFMGNQGRGLKLRPIKPLAVVITDYEP